MNKKIIWGIGAIALVALVLSLKGLVGGNQSVLGSATLTSVNGGNYVAYNAVETSDGYYVGSTQVIDSSGNIDATDDVSIGGVTLVTDRVTSLTASASTTCSLVSPSSTSTLLSSSLKLTSGFVGATIQVEAGKAYDPYSTTTSLGIGVFTSGLKQTFVASTTPYAAVDGPLTFGPSQYLNYKVGTTTSSVHAGTCSALWMVN